MNSTTNFIRDFAVKHGISELSVSQLVAGLHNTGGTQVQFNIPEFGGMGQWMPGMVMASDLFNHTLKARVDAVCSDIAQQVLLGEKKPMPSAGGSDNVSPRLAPKNWWPGDLGVPTTTGGQNQLRYAWFPDTRRLAVDLHGNVWVYDTRDHRIAGVSQHQSGTGMTLTFTSQFGIVDLATLPVIARPES